jgi:hypothetical protein
MGINQNEQQQLMVEILKFKYDPLGFVLFAFPWGVKGTPLERFPGPRTWQVEEFERLREHMEANKFRMSIGLDPEPFYLAISSGRGTGKSAFLAMLDAWVMSCWLGGTIIKTANTETQLRSRTMAEAGKWKSMLINSHWFDKTALKITPTKWFGNLLIDQLKMDTQYYYTEGQSWSEENPDAFAGAHSQIAMVLQFDEASGIPDPIWNISEGFFTDLAELRVWIAISNPRRNTGRFFDCFHKNSAFWKLRYIDSRDVEGTDTAVYQRIADQFGEDHDETRVNVKGQFPRTGSNQFIGREVVEDSALRDLVSDPHAPLLMAVDVARYGEDESVIRFRQGRDARSHQRYAFKGLDLMTLAAEIAVIADRHRPAAIFVDGGGVGGGVVDRLKQLGYRVIEVQFGSRAKERDRYLNKRVEMYAAMRDWLVYGCIDDAQRLQSDLTNLEYQLHPQTNQLRLETKDELRKRGLPSPNDADALAMTFAEPIAHSDIARRRNHPKFTRHAVMEYEEFGT